jgi:hypothetical protein
MIRTITTSTCCFLFALTSFAQAYEGSVDYEKKKQAALVIDYSYSPDAVEGAIVDKLERLGLQAKEQKGLFNSSKGFRNYKGAIMSDISSSSIDYCVKVEQKGRKGNDEATLYLIMFKDGTNLLSSRDDDVISKAKSFLNSLLPEVEAFNLELKIKDQETTVSKAEKKYKDLRDDQESMEKKIKKLEEDLKENAKDQQDQQKEIERQKQILEVIKNKRKA